MSKDKYELAQKYGAAQEFGDRFVSAIEDKPLKCFETYLICGRARSLAQFRGRDLLNTNL